VRTFCVQGGEGSSDEKSEVFGTKNFGFFEIYNVSARTRKEGVSQCGQGEELKLSQFSATSFMDGPYSNSYRSRHGMIVM